MRTSITSPSTGSGALTWPARLFEIDARSAAALFLTWLYTARYLGYPALPGADVNHPLGWWTWWDQSKFLESASALAAGDFAPGQHFYPLGYALMGAPFASIAPLHMFFFVDLASLLASLAAFAWFARHCGVSSRVASLVFVASVAGDRVLFQQWVVPWNTTPAAAAVWTLLALAASHVDGRRRPVLLGLVAVSIPILRPTDAVLTIPALAVCLWTDLERRRLSRHDVLGFATAVAVPAILYACVYLRIYGPHSTPYMDLSSRIGFTFHQFGLKAYVMLVDLARWIGSGEGLLRRCPWMIIGMAGIVPAMRRRTSLTLAATLLLHCVLYLAYADLTPMGLWRYLNVHYYTWTFPGFALLAMLLARDLLVGASRGRPLALAGLATAVLLLCVRFDPSPAASGQSVDAIDFPITPDFDGVYLGALSVTDDRGTLSDGADIRAVAMPSSFRVLMLKRALHGSVSAAGGGVDTAPASLLRAQIRFGLPHWPRVVPGEFGPR